jgi:hypothetical protein
MYRRAAGRRSWPVGRGGGHENAQQGRSSQPVLSLSAYGALARESPTHTALQTGPRYPHRRSSMDWSRFPIILCGFVVGSEAGHIREFSFDFAGLSLPLRCSCFIQ